MNSSSRPCGKIPYSFGPRALSARMANITLSRTMASAPYKKKLKRQLVLAQKRTMCAQQLNCYKVRSFRVSFKKKTQHFANQSFLTNNNLYLAREQHKYFAFEFKAEEQNLYCLTGTVDGPGQRKTMQKPKHPLLPNLWELCKFIS